MESGVHVFIIPEKLLHSQRENKRQVEQLHCVSLSSPSQSSGFADPSIFTENFASCALCPDSSFSLSAAILSVSCCICFHIAFFLFFS